MINKLVDKIKETNAPIVVGLDPMLSYVPEHIQKAAFAEFGETPAGAAEAIGLLSPGVHPHRRRRPGGKTAASAAFGHHR